MKHHREKEFIKDFSKHLRLLRETNSLKQSDITAKSHFEFNAISKIEKGERDVRLSTIFAIAKALNVHPIQLLDFEVNYIKKPLL
jgi:transcriptional regulator with XRE-family HTH domain